MSVIVEERPATDFVFLNGSRTRRSVLLGLRRWEMQQGFVAIGLVKNATACGIVLNKPDQGAIREYRVHCS